MQEFSIEKYAFSLINDSPDMIGFAFIEEPFSRVYLNPAGLAMVGLESVAAWNTHTVADLFDDADVEHLRNTVIPALKEGKSWVEEADVRNVQTGRRVTVHRRMFPIYDTRSEEVVAFGTISRDITDLKQAQQEAQSAHTKLVAQRERERIARDLHDSALQQLVSMSYEIEALKAEVRSVEIAPGAAARVNRLEDSIKYAIHDARRTLAAMRSTSFDNSSLEQALREEVNSKAVQAGYKAELLVTGKGRILSEDVQDALLRICQESLTNSWKHGKSETVNVSLSYEEDRVVLEVCDKGMGFEVNASRTYPEGSGLGLVGMKERAEAVGGHLEIDSSPGNGCTVKFTVPG